MALMRRVLATQSAVLQRAVRLSTKPLSANAPAVWAGAQSLGGVRQYGPLATTAFAPPRRDGQQAFEVELTARNTSPVNGRLQLKLPLPGLQGLTPIHVQDENATVQDVIDAIKKADPSLKAVDITTMNGTKLARTVHVQELTCMEFVIRLNHLNVLIQNDDAKEDPRARGQNVAFASIKAAIEKDSRTVLPLDEYYRMCINAGAEDAVANKWLRELQRRNVVVHFDRSRNAELKNAIILRPNSTEGHLLLQNALDSELYNLKHERKKREMQEHDLVSEIQKLEIADADARNKARNLPNTYKWVGLVSLSSFYGTLMYLVWDVYSWDVMEPITYFIGFTAVLGNSFYHTITKKDATYTNIWQKKYRKRLAALYEERKLNPIKIDQLKKQLADVERDVEVLTHYEGKP